MRVLGLRTRNFDCVALALDGWRLYCSDQLSKISQHHVNAIARLKPDIIHHKLLHALQSTRRPSNIAAFDCFTDDELQHLLPFITQLKSKHICSNLIEQAVNKGQIELPAPLEAGIGSCSESFYIKGGVSCLRFISPNGEVFYIYQNVSSADAIFFPNRNFIFINQHVSEQQVRESVIYFFSNFKKIVEYSNNRLKNKFAGVLASHGRPYHFYYDTLYGMYQLHKHNLLVNIPAIYQLKGGNYFSFRALFKLKNNEVVLDPTEYQSATFENSTFIIHIGICLAKIKRDLHELDVMDSLLVDQAIKLTSTDTQEKINELSTCQLLIWFGVTVQKRSWQEQIEGGVEIIRLLSEQYPKLGVVFDGWTISLSPTEHDQIEIQNDMGVINQIINRIPPSVKTLSLAGSNSIEKIAIAKQVDLFIANHGTGSINVARFCRKIGVSHFSNRMSKKGHFHFHTVEVAPAAVTDIENPENSRPDYTSYSIEWREIYDLAIAALESNSTGVNKPNN